MMDNNPQKKDEVGLAGGYGKEKTAEPKDNPISGPGDHNSDNPISEP
jgi:hypothetical protein